MLNEKEIYVLGKSAVDENQRDYYSGMGSDIIRSRPAEAITKIETMIERLERVKNFVKDYKETLEKEHEDEPEW